MAKLRVHNLSMSVDGFSAGPDQREDQPLGAGGEALHEWVFATRTWRARTGEGGGSTGVDDDFLIQGDAGVGATVMGRNMFGPVRGEWPDESWRGWWGEEPPYHHDVFVLTHHAREPIPMAGGTTFHFVTDGIESALDQAFSSAGGLDVRLGGGASTVQQYLRAGLVDELHVAIAPVVLGGGTRLFDDDGGLPVGYEVAELIAAPTVAHVRLTRRV
jgi:dihydrofolate reductase